MKAEEPAPPGRRLCGRRQGKLAFSQEISVKGRNHLPAFHILQKSCGYAYMGAGIEAVAEVAMKGKLIAIFSLTAFIWMCASIIVIRAGISADEFKGIVIRPDLREPRQPEEKGKKEFPDKYYEMDKQRERRDRAAELEREREKGADIERAAAIYLQFGNACLNEGKYDKAVALYTAAIGLKPNFGTAYYSRAIAYYHQRQYHNAWNDVRQAQNLGREVDANFLKLLKKASGRER